MSLPRRVKDNLTLLCSCESYWLGEGHSSYTAVFLWEGHSSYRAVFLWILMAGGRTFILQSCDPVKLNGWEKYIHLSELCSCKS